MKKHFFIILIIVKYLSVSFCLAQGVTFIRPSAIEFNPDDYGVIVFNEEFDHPLDETIWYPQYVWGNTAPSYLYYARPENLIVENSMLNIIAKKEDYGGKPYTAGTIWSKQKFKFGYFEIRCKQPVGNGLWPAFWLYGPGPAGGTDEIDIMEGNGHASDLIHYDVHCNHGCQDAGLWQSIAYWSGAPIDFTDFHTFGVLWSEQTIGFYVDRFLMYKYNKDFGYSQSIVANLAISPGGFVSPSVDNTTPFPSTFVIDYIKVWQQVHCQSDMEYCNYATDDDRQNTILTGRDLTIGNATNTCNVTLSPIINEWGYTPRFLDLIASNSINIEPGVNIDRGASFSAKILTSCPKYALKSAPAGDSFTADNRLNNLLEKMPTNFSIFPNPSSGFFTIQIPGELKNYTLLISNQLGVIVYHQLVNSQNIIHLNLSTLETGVYLIRMISNEETYCSKIILE
jgi:beta-glucanase (GH16 family)